MTQEFKSGDKVVMAWRVGVIVSEKKKRSGIEGYNVQSLTLEPGDGTLPHFYEAWLLKPAVVGINICREPRGSHWCGLIHVTDPSQYPIKEGK